MQLRYSEGVVWWRFVIENVKSLLEAYSFVYPPAYMGTVSFA